jgi:uncharacterized protein (TIGR03086 family)
MHDRAASEQQHEWETSTMSTEILEQAFASTRSVLAAMSPDQLDDPTPCASWKVRDLVNHIVGGATYFAVTMESGTSPSTEESGDFANGDITKAFDEGTKRALSAFSAEGAMERVVKAAFGEVPGSVFVWIASVDTFTHGWDLATATGHSTDLDPALAAQLLEVSRLAVADDLRGDDRTKPFGLEVEVPATAPAADRLAGFLGRRP